MQFPFDEPDDDTDSRRIPRALAICVACVLLVGLFGLGNLIFHRHQATQDVELATATTGTVEQTPDDDTAKPKSSVDKSFGHPTVAVTFGSDVPSITAKLLKVFGQRYKDQIVQMEGCHFFEINNVWADIMAASHAPEYRSFCGFHVDDSEGNSFQFAFASRDRFGDVLLRLKRGQRIALKGKCVELPDHPGQYGLICTDINE